MGRSLLGDDCHQLVPLAISSPKGHSLLRVHRLPSNKLTRHYCEAYISHRINSYHHRPPRSLRGSLVSRRTQHQRKAVPCERRHRTLAVDRCLPATRPAALARRAGTGEDENSEHCPSREGECRGAYQQLPRQGRGPRGAAAGGLRECAMHSGLRALA